MKKVGYGRAHSKIILMGEHSVVYGYPAIALPLREIEVTCRIEKAVTPIRLNMKNPLSVAIFAALDYLEIDKAHIKYRIESQIPEKRGMGSSAAVAIAAVRAVFDYYEADLADDLLERLVNQAEMIAHTSPSGLDAKTCLSDSAIKFIRNIGFSELDFSLNAYLVIADTGLYGHTSQAVERVKDMGEKALPLLSRLGDLAELAQTQIEQANPQGLGEQMIQAHEVLKELGVSSTENDHLVNVALEAGALGAKLTGGGLGGCIIALVETQEQADRLSRLLLEKGAVNTWTEKL